jgi:Domain of unknown function (DUF222)
MSTAPAAVMEQAERLLKTARLLPADEAAKTLDRVATMAQAAQAQILAEAERSGELADSGCATVRSFAAAILRRSPTEANAIAQVALNLVFLPKLAAAHADGRVPTPHLRMVLRFVKAAGLAALQANEGALVELASTATPREVAEFCRAIADLHRPDRDEAKARAAGLRSVSIRRVGDLAHVDAMLDPVIADQLKATLAAMAKAARTPEDTRTYAERQAQALEDVLVRGMDATDLPAQARRRPHATLTVALETLLGMPGHGHGLLHRFGIIPHTVSTRLSCDALVRLVVTRGQKVLNVGRLRRTVTDRQHAALAVQYQACVFPGCRVRFADCEIHHLWWWSLGGPTDADLQVPLCRSHHTSLHDGGFTLARHDGRLVFRDRCGRLIVNTDQILTDQLDLLAEKHAPPDTADSASELDAEIAATLREAREWASAPYDIGTWGWTGSDPAPPPGHAPPPQWPDD